LENEGEKMKASFYNLWIEEIEENENLFLYNTLTGAFVRVNPDNIGVIKNILKDPNNKIESRNEEVFKQLLYGGFIIPDGLDELKILKFRNMWGRFRGVNSFGLVIAPTLACNFRCLYCYQQIKEIDMSEDVQNQLVEFVKKALKEKKFLGVTWYGGEPLLRWDIISKLTEKFIEICSNDKIEYSSGIITNGFLLENNVISKLEEYKINQFQITLDGPRDVHNMRRKLARGGPTFDTILNNIKKLIDNTDVRIIIRANIDKESFEKAPELLDLLEKENILKKISLSFSPVFSYTEANINYIDNCFVTREYAELEIKFFRDALEKNILTKNLPSPKLGFCSADSWGSYVIDPEGFLYKCWTDIGEKEWSVGHIKDNNVRPKLFDYLGWDPFEFDECRKCLYLPICMGGCPRLRLSGKKLPEICTSWKYNLRESLKLFYITFQQKKSQKSCNLNK